MKSLKKVRSKKSFCSKSTKNQSVQGDLEEEMKPKNTYGLLKQISSLNSVKLQEPDISHNLMNLKLGLLNSNIALF